MKRRTKDLTKEEIIVTLDTLYTAASSIQGRAAVKLFLRDLLTSSERLMLGRRIIIAHLLIRGGSYGEIQKRLQVGRTTIARVHGWLKDQFPGFEQAIKGMEKELKNREGRKMYATNPLYRLKKKYPLHFLLFPTPKLKGSPKSSIYPKKK